MLAKLFPSRRVSRDSFEPSVPQGQRIYAIGDIHGRRDLLDELLARIEADDAARGAAETTLILLGDLIDRGPESAQVIDRAMALKSQRPSTRFLMGNHEEVFLLALSGDDETLRFFYRIGGKATIESYGLTPEKIARADFAELRALLASAVPPAHLRFLESFEDMIEVGEYLFVHAGIRPDLPLTQQRTKDLRWIRGEFLDFEGPLDRMIVHGHSISREVEIRRHRIGIDTGAFASDRLTALGLEGCGRWFLQTGG